MVGYPYPDGVLYELFIFGWQMKHPIAPALGCFLFMGAHAPVGVRVTPSGLPPEVTGSNPLEYRLSQRENITLNTPHGRFCAAGFDAKL